MGKWDHFQQKRTISISRTKTQAMQVTQQISYLRVKDTLCRAQKKMRMTFFSHDIIPSPHMCHV